MVGMRRVWSAREAAGRETLIEVSRERPGAECQIEGDEMIVMRDEKSNAGLRNCAFAVVDKSASTEARSESPCE